MGALSVAAGCGGDDEDSREPPGPPPPAGATELTVTLHPEGRREGPRRSAEVSCAAGSEASASAEAEAGACEAVAALPDDAAAPVPPAAVCTQIYGGPDVVRIEGILEGEEVDTELTRENGCEIERFDRFRPLLRALFEGYRPGGALRP